MPSGSGVDGVVGTAVSTGCAAVDGAPFRQLCRSTVLIRGTADRSWIAALLAAQAPAEEPVYVHIAVQGDTLIGLSRRLLIRKADSLVLALKYAHRLATTRLFVDLLAAAPRPEADLVVPMPKPDDDAVLVSLLLMVTDLRLALV